jgi:26S proteasome regulatory subunit T1
METQMQRLRMILFLISSDVWFAHKTTCRYVPVHLEYMLTEILKNAFRATVESHYELYGSSSSKELPPVVVTISPGPSSAAPTTLNNPPVLSLRVRDQGGGVSQANMARIFSYAFTTAGNSLSDDRAKGSHHVVQNVGWAGSTDMDEADESNVFSEMAYNRKRTALGTFFGLGYGLPMSRLYAKCVMHNFQKSIY